MCMPPDGKERIKCHFCDHEIELSERDLRWIDTLILHGDICVGDKYVRPPFNFGCPSCGTVFTNDHKLPVSDWKPRPPLKAFVVERVPCDSCGSSVDVIVMSPTKTETSRSKPWRQTWVEHRPWHRSA